MKVLLTAINAKFVHSSLAIRYLRSVTEDLPLTIENLEVSINNHLLDIANRIFDARPDILSLSCYIWNIELVKQLLPLIHKMLPECRIILGGPEVSYETADFMREFPMVNFVVRGEGEEVFPELLMKLYRNDTNFAMPGLAYREAAEDGEIIHESCAVTVADLDKIPFPYDEAEIKALENRIIYYESSRGCPYSCKYCLSCATKGVRYRSLDKVFAELKQFIAADVRQVKFVDRTFNADKKHFLPILEFIAKQNCRTNFHFEIVAYKIDEEVEAVLAKMPPGRVQFEIGIQSTNKATLGKVSRANHWQAMTENINKILRLGTIHLHVDLIIGLPYEDLTSFKQSFNDVYALKAHMLQVGFLKLLKGSGMNEMIEEHQYVYMPQAPYQVIANKYMDYAVIRKLEIFVDVLEHYYNSGHFPNTIDLLMENYPDNPYGFYENFAEFWYDKGLHLAPHSPQKLVDYLLDFAESDVHVRNLPGVKDMLKLDLLIKDKGRFKNPRLNWQELNRSQRDAFFQSEAKNKYIKEYEFKSWRDLMNNYHVELFDFPVDNISKMNNTYAKTAILFNFKDDGKYQIIDLGDVIER